MNRLLIVSVALLVAAALWWTDTATPHQTTSLSASPEAKSEEAKSSIFELANMEVGRIPPKPQKQRRVSEDQERDQVDEQPISSEPEQAPQPVPAATAHHQPMAAPANGAGFVSHPSHKAPLQAPISQTRPSTPQP
ncbi:hypothetical protein [Ferrimonas aestuarii]|uniref:Uncharacterized protein n=1 Tax=Ferrimonas aestuarii TaxID=2569539 RepID=A0A4U1BT28_9GAMM|nr:hypothetical protein [Ferrimonas aestuarii]TKB58299.1 hypothetical protein FCL42_00675 [Ferrimonas aestuarii]